MAVDAGTIYSEVRVELDKLRGDLAKAEARFDQFAKRNQNQSNTTKKSWTQSFQQVNLAGVAAFTGIGLAVRGAIRTFADFEQQLANVRSVAGATPEEFERIEAAARQAGEETRFSASQAADALYNLASAGFDAAESTEALNGVLLLAQATGSDLATASQAVTATISQYGLAAADAAEVSNVFAAAITNSQANMQKLSTALRQAGPVAGSLGISLEETTGALQALFDAGFQGEQAGTALRNILGSLSNATDPVVQKLGELGVAFEDVDPAANSLTDIIGTLSNAGLEAGDVFNAFGREVGPQLLSLLQTGEQGLIDYTEAVTGTNRAAEAAAIQNDTLAGSTDRFRSTLESATITLVDNFEPVLRAVVDTARAAVSVFSSLPGPVQVAIGIFTAAIPVVGGLAAATTALGGALALVTGPIGLVVAGVSALTGGVVALTGAIRRNKEERLQEEFGEIAEQTGIAAEKIAQVNRQLENADKTGYQDVAGLVRNLAEEFGLTREQVIQLAKANDELSSEYQNQLTALNRQVTAQNLRATLAEAEIEAARRVAEAEADRTDSVEQRVELSRREFLQQQGYTEQQIETILARDAAQRRYQETLRITERRQQAGIESQQEGLERNLQAAKEFQTALVDLDYTAATGGEVGQRLFIQVSEAIDRITQSLQNLDTTQQDVTANNNEALDTAEEYARRLQDLNATEVEAIELERQRAIASVQATDASSGAIAVAISKINEYFDALIEKKAEDEQAVENWATKYGEEINGVLGGFTNLFSQLDALQQAQAQNAIDTLDRQLDAELERINEALQRRLEAEGVAEETKIERLERELEQAKEKGDEETQARLQDEIRRLQIQQEYNAQREAAEEEYQKRTAQLEYESALASWRFSLAQAIANAAQAVTRIWATWAASPPTAWALTAISAAATGVQLAALRSAQPEPPQFQTGGIVLPTRSSGTGTGQTVQVAENGNAEMLLNSGPEGRGFVDAFANAIADRLTASDILRDFNEEPDVPVAETLDTSATEWLAVIASRLENITPAEGGDGRVVVNVPVELDGRLIAEASARYYNNGQVRLRV